MVHRYGTERPSYRRDRVIFLDFDGVLNSWQWAKRTNQSGLLGIDPEAVSRVREIVERTGCLIVVSSTWRLSRSVEALREVFASKGYPEPVPIIGKTRADVSYPEPARENKRGCEIQAWLDEHHEVTTICILDDDHDMAHLLPYLVSTSMEDGIQPRHVEAAVRMLES